MNRALAIDDIVRLIAAEIAREQNVSLSSESLKAFALVQRSWTYPSFDFLWSHIGVNQLCTLATFMTSGTYYVHEGGCKCRLVKMLNPSSPQDSKWLSLRFMDLARRVRHLTFTTTVHRAVMLDFSVFTAWSYFAETTKLFPNLQGISGTSFDPAQLRFLSSLLHFSPVIRLKMAYPTTLQLYTNIRFVDFDHLPDGLIDLELRDLDYVLRTGGRLSRTLRRLRSLQSVKLIGWSLTEEELHLLASLDHLEHLTIDQLDNPLPPGFPVLRELSIDAQDFSTAITCMKSLQTIHLHTFECRFKDIPNLDHITLLMQLISSQSMLSNLWLSSKVSLARATALDAAAFAQAAASLARISAATLRVTEWSFKKEDLGILSTTCGLSIEKLFISTRPVPAAVFVWFARRFPNQAELPTNLLLLEPQGIRDLFEAAEYGPLSTTQTDLVLEGDPGQDIDILALAALTFKLLPALEFTLCFSSCIRTRDLADQIQGLIRSRNEQLSAQ